jgi:hypothetical protein
MCPICAAVLDVDGVGIALVVGGQLQGQVCASNDTAAALERIQFGLGEGPCGSAFASASPVLEANLADAADRWPVFVAEALALGVRAVFSFPLGPGLAGIGAMTLYRNDTGDLTEEQLTDGLVLADLVTEILLTIQLGSPVDDLVARLHRGGGGRVEIHQATGMVAAQLSASPADALSRMRARAWAEQRQLAEVARDIVTRRMRFIPDILTAEEG